MSEGIAQFNGSRLEKTTIAYEKAEAKTERAVYRRDKTRVPILRSVLSGIAAFRTWQLEGCMEDVKEASDMHYYYDRRPA
jgi:hypothetical protein